ncbi:glycosyltransferase family 4 protein [Methanolobus vulcani]|uniref:Glycosyltransferase n=1 Tax=Methanolobus vulcani TaxID=38026 RepID=A0A7Z8KMG9_9EURY|nr:glycosyltransferase family 4 protein [Methanolobus vulcani]TQD23861.1 glycosyltransferase [Methanolobus vulcani]
MKPLLINTSDIHGGAARAAYRLHQGLQQIDINSKMLVQKKISNDTSVIGIKANIKGPRASKWNFMSVARYLTDRLPLIYYNYRNFQQIDWSPQWVPNNIHLKINEINPDIVNLHWICQGFIPIQEIAKIKQPLVWTLHDMWAFTGGCHYSETCYRFKHMCGKCPQLSSNKETDLSNWVWKRKKKYWENIDFTIVTPSNWLATCARSSSLFQDKEIEVIPNGIDLQKFKPINKNEARKALKLPLDKNLILFGAMNSTHDQRKGFQFLKPAIEILSKDLNFETIIFGNNGQSRQENISIPTNYLGYIPDDHLSLLYSSADIMIVPSVQEAFGQTASEAMACGTPVVSFNSTGLIDIVKHKENGYLAKPFDTEDLAKGMEWIVEHDKRKKKLSDTSRKYVEENFELKSVAKRYADLYSKL